MCVCVCVCMYVRMYACTYVCTHTHICILCVCVCVQLCAYVCICKPIINMFVYLAFEKIFIKIKSVVKVNIQIYTVWSMRENRTHKRNETVDISRNFLVSQTYPPYSEAITEPCPLQTIMGDISIWYYEQISA